MSAFIARAGQTGPGLRVAVKDLIDLAGWPTTSGSKVLAASAEPADADAACLAGTRDAEANGEATIVGKTNLHELAFGITGVNPWFGTPINPVDASLIPGGSSSGSAVAVAAGEADVAFGTDTGGSVRIPAACCAVVGLKTTRGRIPTAGVRALAPSLDTVGPLAASVALLAAGMALLEPGFVPAPAPARRIGRFRLPATERIDAALDQALHHAGLQVEEVALPGWDDASHAVETILCAEAWEVHGQLWHQSGPDLSPDVGPRLEAASLIGREETAEAWEKARRWWSELQDVLTNVQVLALPVLADEPPDLDHPTRIGAIRYTAPINLAGLPALALPVPDRARPGRVRPSLQLVGRAGGEELLVATAAAIEEATG